MIWTIILLTITGVLNIVDYFQTIYAVQFFGLGVELNPIAHFLFNANCEWIKLIIVPIMLIILGFAIKTNKSMSWTAWVLAILYLVVVINNFSVLMQLGIMF